MPAERWRPAYIGIGSNLDEPEVRVQRAIDALRALPGLKCVAVSSLWRTAPIGTEGQPDYINAVAAGLWALEPITLLERLLETERAHGRQRDGVRWAPRRLDLDLLLLSDVCVDSEALTLPHPRMAERAFVLEPLFEVAPTLNVPGHGSLAHLRRALPDQRVEQLEAVA